MVLLSFVIPTLNEKPSLEKLYDLIVENTAKTGNEL